MQLLEICRHLDARYAATLVPYIAHTLQLTLCELWSWTYTMQLQLRIFRLQYSTERICGTIGDISTMQCSLYWNLGANYRAHPPVYAMRSVIPDIYSAFTAPHIQASIFCFRYLRCYCRDHDKSMRVLLQTWCQISRTSTSLLNVNCGPDHI
jgi:hypothetical protein